LRAEAHGSYESLAMHWKKSPPGLVALFEKAVPKAAHVDTRKMFGYPACFARGNMFMGLYQESFIVRLGEADREALLALPSARRFEPMPGRPMKEYVMLPASVLTNHAELAAWVARALDYGLSLPAKTAKRSSAGTQWSPTSRKPSGAKPLGGKATEANKKARPRTTGIPPRPRRQSGTVKKAAPGRSR
jgi:TfoX/Sxy family transcriptional regulator of competence genes